MAAGAAENLLTNGGFEQGLDGWGPFWSRTPAGKATVDAGQFHTGTRSVRIEHTGTEDWSFPYHQRFPVRPGEMYELSGWVCVEDRTSVTLGVILYNGQQNAIDWVYGGRTAGNKPGWQELRCRLVIPPGGAMILPRLIGYKTAKAWLDDVTLAQTGSVPVRPGKFPAQLHAASHLVDLTLNTVDATMVVVDRRTGAQWTQKPQGRSWLLDAAPAERGFDLRLLDPGLVSPITVAVRLDREMPEFSVELSSEGEMSGNLGFPHPFVTDQGTWLILPMNEGISYPVDDRSLPPAWHCLYGGHGLCMAWWGVTDGRKGLMGIVGTPDDAAVHMTRVDGRLCLAPQWEPQRGQFGPVRRIRYVLVEEGGYTGMCKRYRRHAHETGLLKTLAQKRAESPNVDQLVGAVNVWCFAKDGPAMARQMLAAGIDRILWSNAQSAENLRKLNELGVLTSRYDIYQDVQNPANYPTLPEAHDAFCIEAWPKDLILGSDGDWLRGWEVDGRDGKRYPCGILCDSRAVGYARKRIPEELKTHPYRCRFIDTTTAAPWHECYHPDHLMTRTESRQHKMDLLRYVSRECRLVCGSETGHEAAVPYVHYFEGMLSLGPYRVPDAGRAMEVLWEKVPEPVAKFQTGHYYRVPLWELVYHDCVVAQWYWGDYNNKLPGLWDRRDLWNALYGTPPMFMLDQKKWDADRDRFVRSYRATAPIARATGYAEMLSHRWLTEDHAVQETRFAGDVRVTVNFGDRPYRMEDGTMLAALGCRVEGGQMTDAE